MASMAASLEGENETSAVALSSHLPDEMFWRAMDVLGGRALSLEELEEDEGAWEDEDEEEEDDSEEEDESAEDDEESEDEEDEAGAQPRVGLWGQSRTLGTKGRIVEISGKTGRVTLETDDARLVVPADDVAVVDEPISGPSPRDLAAEDLRRRAAARVSPTIDLHGERVEAALERLAEYLDDALLAGLDSVVIVHGVGTGALRRAVRDALREHPRVRGYRGGRKDEGGEGATVAEL